MRRHGRHVQGHREDDVEVLDVEEVLCAGVDPGRAFQRLTLGTMPIRAGIIGDALVATRRARFDMPTEDGGAARLDRGHDASLGGRQRGTGCGTIGVAVAAEDIRHLQRRTIHERASTGGRGGAIGRWRRMWKQVERARGRTDLRRGDPQIAGGGLETAMAEEQLNRAQVGAGF